MRKLLLTWMPALVLASCLFTACKKEEEKNRSLDLNGGEGLEGAAYVDTFRLKALTSHYEATLTDNLGFFNVGRIGDPSLGTGDELTGSIYAKGFFQLSPGANKDSVHRNHIEALDTLIIELPFGFARRTLTGRNLQVALRLGKLRSRLAPDSVYFANSLRDTGEYLATATIIDTGSVVGLIFAGGLAERIYTARFKIGGPMASTLADLLKTRTTALTLNELINVVPGFSLQTSYPNMFSVLLDRSPRAYLRYYYPIASRRTGLLDSAKKAERSLALNSDADPHHYYTLEFNRTGKPIEALNPQTGHPDTLISDQGLAYVQNGAGYYAHFSFPSLNDFLRAVPSTGIVRADLELRYTRPLRPRPLSVVAWKGRPDVLALSRNNPLTNAIVNVDEGLGAVNVPLDSTRGLYRINITRYVSDIALGRTSNNGVTVSSQVFDRGLIPIEFTTDPASEKRAVLRVYYQR